MLKAFLELAAQIALLARELVHLVALLVACLRQFCRKRSGALLLFARLGQFCLERGGPLLQSAHVAGHRPQFAADAVRMRADSIQIFR
jgi:hypothetical protein